MQKTMLIEDASDSVFQLMHSRMNFIFQDGGKSNLLTPTSLFAPDFLTFHYEKLSQT